MSDPTSPKGGGLWARLFNMASDDDQEKNASPPDPAAPAMSSTPLAHAVSPDMPMAAPVALPIAVPVESTDEISLAIPVAPRSPERAALDEAENAEEPSVPADGPPDWSDPESDPSTAPAPQEKDQDSPFVNTDALVEAAVVIPQACMACGGAAPSRTNLLRRLRIYVSHGRCGAHRSNHGFQGHPREFPMPTPNARIKGRYELGELLSDNRGVFRQRGLDHGSGKPLPVTIVWAPLNGGAQVAPEEIAMPVVDEEILPDFDETVPVAEALEEDGGIGWEKTVLESARHPAVPAAIEYFQEDDREYLIEEAPQGVSLWDAWDDPDADAAVRYGWLIQIAEGMQSLQMAGALIEGIRPDLVVVTPQGQAMIADLSELLPLPLPSGAPIKATLYTAPEVILTPDQADARAGLYSFGAMIYSLEYLHHPLEEKNFEHQLRRSRSPTSSLTCTRCSFGCSTRRSSAICAFDFRRTKR